MSETSTTSEIASALTRLAAGDASAREYLLSRTQTRMHRLASRMLHGGFARVEKFEESDDVMQTMFLRLLKGWDNIVKDETGAPLKDAGVFLSRVSRLLREVLLDMARQHYGRNGNRPGQLQLDVGGDSTDAGRGYDPGNETHNPEALALFTEFHNAVEGLPDNLRQVVDLHWYQDLTHREVGEVIGVAEVTARTHWVSARVQLCKRLGSNPFDRYGE